MILIRHSAGIYKVCIDTAKLLRFLVHHICKGSYRSGNLYSYLCCHIICWPYHQRQQTLTHRQHLAYLHADISTVRCLICQTFLCKCHLIIQIAVFQCQKCRHDLCDTRRISLFIHSLIIKDCSCICIHQHCCLRISIRALWPAFYGIRCDRIRCPVIHLCRLNRDSWQTDHTSQQPYRRLFTDFSYHNTMYSSYFSSCSFSERLQIYLSFVLFYLISVLSSSFLFLRNLRSDHCPVFSLMVYWK